MNNNINNDIKIIIIIIVVVITIQFCAKWIILKLELKHLCVNTAINPFSPCGLNCGRIILTVNSRYIAVTYNMIDNTHIYMERTQCIKRFFKSQCTRSGRYFREEVFPWFFSVGVSISSVCDPLHEIDLWLNFRHNNKFYGAWISP